MARLLALYPKPADPEAFNAHYWSKHVPLTAKMPGLQAFRVNSEPLAGPSAGDFHLIAEMEFASRADLDRSLASPEGAAAAADVANFAPNGVVLLITETETIEVLA